jgi:hypothetical protein
MSAAEVEERLVDLGEFAWLRAELDAAINARGRPWFNERLV